MPSVLDQLDPAIRSLRKQRQMRAIADALNIKRQAPYTWRRVPAEHVLAIAELTGMSPHEIRPDLYPAHLFR
jgi:DNA-binding transcriptional regulator YdaS (Cro superfamily)